MHTLPGGVPDTTQADGVGASVARERSGLGSGEAATARCIYGGRNRGYSRRA